MTVQLDAVPLKRGEGRQIHQIRLMRAAIIGIHQRKGDHHLQRQASGVVPRLGRQGKLGDADVGAVAYDEVTADMRVGFPPGFKGRFHKAVGGILGNQGVPAGVRQFPANARLLRSRQAVGGIGLDVYKRQYQHRPGAFRYQHIWWRYSDAGSNIDDNY